ncbi:hypothetical protein K438DRAFT_1849502, partial [Mycena galopus ATCC 62051]
VGDSEVLPVPSRIYVISLPRRTVLYQDMAPLVAVIMSQVPSLRQEALGKAEHPPNITVKLPFKWSSSDIAPTSFGETTAPVPVPASDFKPPLTCATQNFTLSPYSPRLGSPAGSRTYLSAIQRAPTHERDKAALILEDDVERLSSIWSLLPSDWDILSHDFDLPSSTSTTLLHPSHGPLCTHAYALSPAGTKRLLSHLMHPPFACSRAIDHARAWLVRSAWLNSFSVVPSVVVQRKVGKSDVMPIPGKGKGSRWRDRLVHGVLADSDATPS